MKIKQFGYKVEKLIDGVRRKPALWDKTLEIYKDREERRQAWEYIFRLLEVDYEKMSPEDKKATADIITTKWTNIRDTFSRSLKVQSNKANTKKYLYHDEMAFLLKIIPHSVMQSYNESDADEDPISCKINLKRESSDKYESEGETSVTPNEIQRSKKMEREYITPEPEPRRRKRSKKSEIRQPHEEDQDMDFVEMGDAHDPRIMNEDEAFFASLLPTVVKYSEEERLEFRIEVLAVMKSINQNRKKPANYDTDN